MICYSVSKINYKYPMAFNVLLTKKKVMYFKCIGYIYTLYECVYYIHTNV